MDRLNFLNLCSICLKQKFYVNVSGCHSIRRNKDLICVPLSVRAPCFGIVLKLVIAISLQDHKTVIIWMVRHYIYEPCH